MALSDSASQSLIKSLGDIPLYDIDTPSFDCEVIGASGLEPLFPRESAAAFFSIKSIR
jgi:hypothetical protein